MGNDIRTEIASLPAYWPWYLLEMGVSPLCNCEHKGSKGFGARA
jgi:hypothetical protein